MTVTVGASRPPLNVGNVIAMIWAVLVFVLSLGLLGFGLFWGITSFGLSDPGQRYPRLILGIVVLVAGGTVLIRYARLLSAIFRQSDYKRARQTMRIDLIQGFLVLVLVGVLFPVLDSLYVARPTRLLTPNRLDHRPTGS